MKYLLFILGVWSASLAFLMGQPSVDKEFNPATFFIGSGLGVLLIFVAVILAIRDLGDK